MRIYGNGAGGGRVLNKPLVLTFAVLYSLMMVIGSTFAWITTSYSRVNEFKGEMRFGAAITEDFVANLAWRPGTTVKKELKVTNIEKVPAFIRISYKEVMTSYSVNLATGNSTAGVHETITVDYGGSRTGSDDLEYLAMLSANVYSSVQSSGTDYWLLASDGYLYYSEALLPGEATALVCTGIEMKGNAPNRIKNAGYTLSVKMEAVQAYTDALGTWGISGGSPVDTMLAGKGMS
jgi:alternate signal-mediated exported protein